ncbi:MAG: DEAD/DEAH box helicase [Treponema sp.]|jgi:superfamily II DNA/RNA helicase|nr:DEAD/DEAH box helicase [Treponema sp.]
MNTFDNLGIHPQFIEKLKERSIVQPTAIQSLVIPRLLDGKNLLFRSATGTGKTFAYLLPALQQIFSGIHSVTPLRRGTESQRENRHNQPLVLICAPTLELCSQIKAEVDFLSSGTNLQTALLIGSVNIDKQIENLKKTKPAVIVGNPPRLLVLSKMRKLKFTKLQFLVLDEADRLTAQECLEETKELLAVIKRDMEYAAARDSREDTPRLVVRCACSATVDKKTCSQLGTLFENAEIIESADHEILRERIEHWAIFSEKRRKVQTLRSLLAAIKGKPARSGKKSRLKALVFTSRNDEAGKILSQLQYHHLSAAGLFGKINNKPITGTERKAALDSFRGGKTEVLVSTDLAGRGLDIPGITHVIAMDVPSESEVYIHRCGRTGRAGKRGIMVTIGDETQMRLLASLEKKLMIRINPKELYEGRICVPQP